MSHPDIQEAVIYGITQEQDGSLQEKQANGDISRSQKIRAYIVKANGSHLTAQDVEDFFVQQAPAMKNLSGGVVFLDSIPKTTVSPELFTIRKSYLGCV